MNSLKIFMGKRNNLIYYMFKTLKFRQKTIANIHGLSEQRVKHIIVEVKKQQEI